MTEQEKQELIETLRKRRVAIDDEIASLGEQKEATIAALVRLLAKFKKGDRVTVNNAFQGVVDSSRHLEEFTTSSDLCIVYAIRLLKKDGKPGRVSRHYFEEALCLTETPLIDASPDEVK